MSKLMKKVSRYPKKPGRRLNPTPGYYKIWNDKDNWDWTCQVLRVSPKLKIVTIQTITCDAKSYIGVITRHRLREFQNWAQKTTRKHVDLIKGQMI